jgi:toxin-antitoxin system PIN domain toxin
MSYSLDVNLLLFASNTNSERCVAAQKFLVDCAGSPELLCVATVTITGYLRIATHPRIFETPLSVREAERNVERLLSLPQCVLISEQDGFWQAYRKVTLATPARANDVPDAHLATVLFQNGVTRLYTHDRDFRRYDFLKVIDPFDPA